MIRLFFISLLLSFHIHSYLESLPAQVMIIRHAEKPEKGRYLSEKGLFRSKALASYFQDNAFAIDHGVAAAIFASSPEKNTGSQRSIQTVLPLAEALNMPVIADYNAEQTQEIATEILTNPAYDKKTVLISWRHSKISELAFMLGVKPEPPRYPGSRFDLVYKINYLDGSAQPELVIGLQKLLPDDSFKLPERFSLYADKDDSFKIPKYQRIDIARQI